MTARILACLIALTVILLPLSHPFSLRLTSRRPSRRLSRQRQSLRPAARKIELLGQRPIHPAREEAYTSQFGLRREPARFGSLASGAGSAAWYTLLASLRSARTSRSDSAFL
jgi:hypothetical protein